MLMGQMGCSVLTRRLLTAGICCLSFTRGLSQALTAYSVSVLACPMLSICAATSFEHSTVWGMAWVGVLRGLSLSRWEVVLRHCYLQQLASAHIEPWVAPSTSAVGDAKLSSTATCAGSSSTTCSIFFAVSNQRMYWSCGVFGRQVWAYTPFWVRSMANIGMLSVFCPRWCANCQQCVMFSVTRTGWLIHICFVQWCVRRSASRSIVCFSEFVRLLGSTLCVSSMRCLHISTGEASWQCSICCSTAPL